MPEVLDCCPLLAEAFFDQGEKLIIIKIYCNTTSKERAFRERKSYYSCCTNRVAMTRAEMAQRGDGGKSPKKRARVANPPRQLDAAQQKRRAQMKAHMKKSVALETTMAVVDEHMMHTLRWNAVAEKYVDYVWLVGDVLLEKYPDLALKSDDSGEVDPWPVNGLPFHAIKLWPPV